MTISGELLRKPISEHRCRDCGRKTSALRPNERGCSCEGPPRFQDFFEELITLAPPPEEEEKHSGGWRRTKNCGEHPALHLVQQYDGVGLRDHFSKNDEYGDPWKEPQRKRRVGRAQTNPPRGVVPSPKPQEPDATSRFRARFDHSKLLEKFDLLEKLGEGGMGAVFHVRDKMRGSELAIKVMRPEFAGDRAALKRFQKEAAAAGELTHPNIAQVYGCTAEDAAPYMVMEFVDGISLSDVIKHERVFDYKRVIHLCLQICDALHHAHMKGVVHRDLKPSNIIVIDGAENETVKLVDFGIAKLLPNKECTTALTKSGEIFGSPDYMSPEQARGDNVDHRTDIYSLGCIMFEMLSGCRLYRGDNPIHILIHHINTPPRKRLELLKKKGVPTNLIRLIEKMLDKRADHRFPTALAVAAELRRIQLGRSTQLDLRRRWLVGSMVGVAMIATWAISQWHSNTNRTVRYCDHRHLLIAPSYAKEPTGLLRLRYLQQRLLGESP